MIIFKMYFFLYIESDTHKKKKKLSIPRPFLNTLKALKPCYCIALIFKVIALRCYEFLPFILQRMSTVVKNI